MHPAASLIYFTSASGLGFGFLFFLALGMPELAGWQAFWVYVVAFALAVTGLCASLLHLGNPQRAAKALTQWRTSWLSREGVVAIAALLIMAAYAALQVFWGATYAWLGLVGAILCVLTVVCTAMIYAQLKTIPRWNQPATPLLFLAYAATGGALLAQAHAVALIALAILIGLQILHWLWGDQHRGASTSETATGLGHLGKVRLLERPHTGKNYLTTEMVHEVGRKHALKLRGLVMILLLLVFLPAVFGSYGLWGALVPLVLGLLVSRWLFFGEAEHSVGLYYQQG